jgi:hypothetical protein
MIAKANSLENINLIFAIFKPNDFLGFLPQKPEAQES